MVDYIIIGILAYIAYIGLEFRNKNMFVNPVYSISLKPFSCIHIWLASTKQLSQPLREAFSRYIIRTWSPSYKIYVQIPAKIPRSN